MRPPLTPSQAPSEAQLAQYLTRSGIPVTQEKVALLWRYHTFLRQRNQGQALTRLIGFETMCLKHYVDCLLIGRFGTLPSPLLDLGTGAGFPGIPLKIWYPELELVLAEPRPNLLRFLSDALLHLKLKKTKLFPHRVVSQSFQEPVQGVITRAVEPMVKTAKRTSGCLPIGGSLYFMKGPSVAPEITEMESTLGHQFELTLDQAYHIPHTPHQRRLVIWKRTT